MNITELKSEVLPLANEVYKTAEPGEATEERSAIKSATFEWQGIKFQVLGQNLQKRDRKSGELTRFSKLANNKHEVFWVIRQDINEWFLIVDGKWIQKSEVTPEGTLIAGLSK